MEFAAELSGIFAAADDPDENAFRQRVAEALGELPEEQRAVLLLIGVEDLSYQETARVLRVPIGTVMSRLSRGRERLRRSIHGDLDENSRRCSAALRRVK